MTGQFLCALEAREFLRRGIVHERSLAWRKIICMSSLHEMIPLASHANYAASKAAINMLLKAMAQEYGRQKIRINSICPGAIITPINKVAWEKPEAYNNLMTLISNDRIGTTEDIRKPVVFPASDDSAYLTGASIFIDGGMTVFEGFATGGQEIKLHLFTNNLN